MTIMITTQSRSLYANQGWPWVHQYNTPTLSDDNLFISVADTTVSVTIVISCMEH